MKINTPVSYCDFAILSFLTDPIHDPGHPLDVVVRVFGRTLLTSFNPQSLRCDSRTGPRPNVRVPGLEMPWNPDTNLTIYSNPLKFFVSPCPESRCHTVYFPVFSTGFFFLKVNFFLCRDDSNINIGHVLSPDKEYLMEVVEVCNDEGSILLVLRDSVLGTESTTSPSVRM